MDKQHSHIIYIYIIVGNQKKGAEWSAGYAHPKDSMPAIYIWYGGQN